jgi:hypothetical protein
MAANRKTKLTTERIKKLKPEAKRYRVWDSAVAGYFIQVYPSGVKTFGIRYSGDQGAKRDYIIGKLGKYTAETARKAAVAKAGEIAKGVDIQTEKKRQRATEKADKAAKLGAFIKEEY